jgi:hypothetical protein
MFKPGYTLTFAHQSPVQWEFFFYEFSNDSNLDLRPTDLAPGRSAQAVGGLLFINILANALKIR